MPRVRGRVGEARVGAVLDRIGTETLHDIILPDGRGGLTQIDHLVLTGASLLVVETKNYSGSIFGQERESQWTQKLGPQTNRFQNPLRQNYGHIQAVQALVPGVPVLGRVVFTDDARFQQGMPASVVEPERPAARTAPSDGGRGTLPPSSPGLADVKETGRPKP